MNTSDSAYESKTNRGVVVETGGLSGRQTAILALVFFVAVAAGVGFALYHKICELSQ